MPERFYHRITELDLTGRSFLTIYDYTSSEIMALLDLAHDLKRRRSVVSRSSCCPAAPSR